MQGEPAGQPLHAWPHVSCDFGNFDIAGHPKSHAYWYAANWLQGFADDEPGRPALPYKTVARILELPGAPTPPDTTTAAIGTEDAKKQATISAVTSAPFAQLFLDGVDLGVIATPRNERGEIQATEWPAAMASSIVLYSGDNCSGVSSFPINASGVQCHNLQRSGEGDKSANACALACCADEGCDTWQLETSDAGGACWIGRADEGPGKCGSPHNKGQIWIGGQRFVSPAPPPPPPFRNATMRALSAQHAGGKVLATHSLFAPSADDISGYKLQLTLDVPSASTGTGNALLLDGRDTALVRCSIVDSHSNNALVSMASNRITWAVKAGAGRVAGTSNGNRSSHEWMKSPSVDSYLGLARGLFKVTQDCTSIARDSCAHIDADAARSPTAVKVSASSCDTSPIIIEASSPGFAPATIAIPVSIDVAKDGVLAVAQATGSDFADGFSYLDHFVG